ncbi:MAG: SH3 domain-containing protein [bacterium]
MKRHLFLLIFLVIICFGFIGSQHVSAVTIIARKQANFDEQLVKEAENYGSSNSIIITPIFVNSSENYSELEWLQGLFYYQAAKLNFGDFTYHYLLLPDGTIYKGNSKGEDQRLKIESTLSGPIVIGYLAQPDGVDFSTSAKDSLPGLILDIVNRQNIALDQVQMKNVIYQVTTEGMVTIKANDLISGHWTKSLDEFKLKIQPQLVPNTKTYNLSIEKVTLPSESVKYGDNVIAKIILKNNSDSVLYQGSDYEPLVSKEAGGFSKFYINEVWISLTQVALMPEGSMLRPGESQEYQVKLAVPLYFGEQIEKFKLINSLGVPYSNLSFDIKLNVLRPDKEIIEISETGVGYLKVRASASGSAEVTTRVSTAQRFIVLERNDGGWVKIDLGNNTSGWVAQQYTKKV